MTGDLLVGKEKSGTDADNGSDEVISFKRRSVESQGPLVFDGLARYLICRLVSEEVFGQEQLALRLGAWVRSLFRQLGKLTSKEDQIGDTFIPH